MADSIPPKVDPWFRLAITALGMVSLILGITIAKGTEAAPLLIANGGMMLAWPLPWPGPKHL